MGKGLRKQKGLSFKRPKPSLLPSVILAALGGVLQTLSWPWPGLWPLCLVALVPLILAVNEQSGKRGFFLGWVYGLSLGMCTLPWLADVMSGYGGLGPVVGWGVLFLLCAFLGLFQGFFGWIITMPAIDRLSFSVLGSITWCGLDWLKNWVLTGFNWTPLAGPLAIFPEMAQAADLVGIYGLGFFVAMVNFFLASAWLNRRERSGAILPYLIGALVIIGALFAYGRMQYGKWEDIALSSPARTVAVVQPSTEQMDKWDAEYRDRLFSKYEGLNEEADRLKPWLILWPETAMPFVLDFDYAETEWLRELSADTDSLILTGVAGLGGAWPNMDKLHNRMILLDGGDLLAYYDKMHLVPFGEYLPLDWLPFLKWAFMQGLIGAAGNFSGGEARPLISVPVSGDGLPPQVKLGVMICFESTFPYIGRDRVREGAELLIVPTNDGWFGRSRAPEQHLLQSSMRAIETRRPLVRAGNTGISALVYPSGRIVQASQLYDVGAFPMDAPIIKSENLITTPFVRQGNMLAPILAALTGLLAIVRYFRK
ncbi:apolipoprotein N-acyltransferase [Deltaproteobacteria bacterium Smac51]|nr:apolipoprotein N-acyltransferase [Deltaproteobacteria bacterium Smac51]